MKLGANHVMNILYLINVLVLNKETVPFYALLFHAFLKIPVHN